MEALRKKIDQRSGGVFKILFAAIQSFSDARGSRSAAAMAYYALFSLFPLLVVLIALSSLFLDDQQAIQSVEGVILEVLPSSRGLIQENLQNVMELRNTVGVIGLVGLMWSASGVFSVLVSSINLAWKQAETRGFVQQRLLALAMIVVLVIALLLLPVLTSILNLLPKLSQQWLDGASIAQPVWFLLSNLIALVFTFVALLALYRWVPKIRLQWKDVFWGALFAAAGLIIVNRGFTFYIGSGLSRYQVIYGTLGAVVALLTWIYLSSLILILGAHLCAAVSSYRTEHSTILEGKDDQRSRRETAG